MFLPNGDYVSSTTQILRFITKNGEVKWSLAGHYHHQLNLSNDGKRLLVMGSVSKSFANEAHKRYDTFQLVDLEGKVLATLGADEIISQAKMEPLKFTNPWPRDFGGVTQEGSHFNSFYEVPASLGKSKVPSFLTNSGYVVNSVSLGVFFLSKDFKRVEHHLRLPTSIDHNVHDVQVSRDGKLLYFNNIHTNESFATKHSTVEELDLATNKLTLVVSADPKPFFYSQHSGSVQQIDKDLILISHPTNGAYLYSRAVQNIIFNSVVPLWDGNKLITAQQVTAQDLRSFLAAQN